MIEYMDITPYIHQPEYVVKLGYILIEANAYIKKILFYVVNLYT